MKILELARHEWLPYSELAHGLAFGWKRPSERDRIDYALLAVLPDNPVGYLTVVEQDGNTAYWQYGGIFPKYQGTIHSYRAYEAALKKVESRYSRITTLIENRNTMMLRMAMRLGFRISGVRCIDGKVYVDHTLECRKESLCPSGSQ